MAGERVTVVGAGLMGHGIAQVFATAGHDVWLVETDPAARASARDRIRQNLFRMARHALVEDRQIEAVVQRVVPTSDLARACAGCDVVIEAVPEDLSLKQRLFSDLGRYAPPRAVLCTNTSAIRIAEIAASTKGRERVLGTHFWNPPFLIPLVEVVRTEETAEWAVEAVYNLLARAGKHPVRVRRDVPGFIGNRLQHALWREAFALIDAGVCDAATVDEVVCNSFGLRLPVLGPVANADLVGLDLTFAIHDYLLKHLNADPTPSTTLRTLVGKGRLGFKTGQGFLEWSEAAMGSIRERLTEHLMKTLAERKRAGDRPASS
ncbi:MAG: 3-hydroxyacyl-CoA dehydrogenase family protein [Armatimonadota bacterium]|nr:3-hydroxyacyl-CoA dehydrogenase family protein [Armatimonadota bacterium]MDR7450987.1 3-hydroxyacyl-CoA dehydrogenase family protein [Armatimonadota bacterium]MDR7465992.1 3-hydroxyacyl-CoA dehydrogenase family protein [Armatimonadota bacterium]MDR7494057.1 3-hydroxyacyl-CoA dehydrogenase family protein [Armatimonadota bacterium]MDR7504076.1 3-hydroxyacyl-CoA dehydrogenase family protein [Armatimonadota bacterium]